MDASKELKESVERAQREIQRLLSEAQAVTPDKRRLETGLKEVERQLGIIDIHIGHHEKS